MPKARGGEPLCVGVSLAGRAPCSVHPLPPPSLQLLTFMAARSVLLGRLLSMSGRLFRKSANAIAESEFMRLGTALNASSDSIMASLRRTCQRAPPVRQP